MVIGVVLRVRVVVSSTADPKVYSLAHSVLTVVASGSAVAISSTPSSLLSINADYRSLVVGSANASSAGCLASWTFEGDAAADAALQAQAMSSNLPYAQLSALTSSRVYLSLLGSALDARKAYTLQLSCLGQQTYAAVTVIANGAPLPGWLDVSPSAGVELATPFALAAPGFSDAEGDYPLLYAFGYLTPSGAFVLLRRRREVAFAQQVLLPAGAQESGRSLAAVAQVFDFYSAHASITAAVTVTRLGANTTAPTTAPTTTYFRSVYTEVVNSYNSSAGSDELLLGLAAAVHSVLNAPNCSLAPNCSSLNRSPCADGETDHACGPCEAGFSGDAGPYGVGRCHNGSAADALIFALANNQSKRCVADCSGQGQCLFFLTSTGDTVDSCYEYDSSCSPRCSCHPFLRGASCALPREVLYTKSALRQRLLEWQVWALQQADVDAPLLTSWSGALLQATRCPAELTPGSTDSLSSLSQLYLADATAGAAAALLAREALLAVADAMDAVASSLYLNLHQPDPSAAPSRLPSSSPTAQPSSQPASSPTGQPSAQPALRPSSTPSSQPTSRPSPKPTFAPTAPPTIAFEPTATPSTARPTIRPTPFRKPSTSPTCRPSLEPTLRPTRSPTMPPTLVPSAQPSKAPTRAPTAGADTAKAVVRQLDLLAELLSSLAYLGDANMTLVYRNFRITSIVCNGRSAQTVSLHSALSAYEVLSGRVVLPNSTLTARNGLYSGVDFETTGGTFDVDKASVVVATLIATNGRFFGTSAGANFSSSSLHLKLYNTDLVRGVGQELLVSVSTPNHAPVDYSTHVLTQRTAQYRSLHNRTAYASCDVLNVTSYGDPTLKHCNASSYAASNTSCRCYLTPSQADSALQQPLASVASLDIVTSTGYTDIYELFTFVPEPSVESSAIVVYLLSSALAFVALAAAAVLVYDRATAQQRQKRSAEQQERQQQLERQQEGLASKGAVRAFVASYVKATVPLMFSSASRARIFQHQLLRHHRLLSLLQAEESQYSRAGEGRLDGRLFRLFRLACAALLVCTLVTSAYYLQVPADDYASCAALSAVNESACVGFGASYLDSAQAYCSWRVSYNYSQALNASTQQLMALDSLNDTQRISECYYSADATVSYSTHFLLSVLCSLAFALLIAPLELLLTTALDCSVLNESSEFLFYSGSVNRERGRNMRCVVAHISDEIKHKRKVAVTAFRNVMAETIEKRNAFRLSQYERRVEIKSFYDWAPLGSKAAAEPDDEKTAQGWSRRVAPALSSLSSSSKSRPGGRATFLRGQGTIVAANNKLFLQRLRQSGKVAAAPARQPTPTEHAARRARRRARRFDGMYSSLLEDVMCQRQLLRGLELRYFDHMWGVDPLLSADPLQPCERLSVAFYDEGRLKNEIAAALRDSDEVYENELVYASNELTNTALLHNFMRDMIGRCSLAEQSFALLLEDTFELGHTVRLSATKHIARMLLLLALFLLAAAAVSLSLPLSARTQTIICVATFAQALVDLLILETLEVSYVHFNFINAHRDAVLKGLRLMYRAIDNLCGLSFPEGKYVVDSPPYLFASQFLASKYPKRLENFIIKSYHSHFPQSHLCERHFEENKTRHERALVQLERQRARLPAAQQALLLLRSAATRAAALARRAMNAVLDEEGSDDSNDQPEEQREDKTTVSWRHLLLSLVAWVRRATAPAAARALQQYLRFNLLALLLALLQRLSAYHYSLQRLVVRLLLLLCWGGVPALLVSYQEQLLTLSTATLALAAVALLLAVHYVQMKACRAAAGQAKEEDEEGADEDKFGYESDTDSDDSDRVIDKEIERYDKRQRRAEERREAKKQAARTERVKRQSMAQQAQKQERLQSIIKDRMSIVASRTAVLPSAFASKFASLKEKMKADAEKAAAAATEEKQGSPGSDVAAAATPTSPTAPTAHFAINSGNVLHSGGRVRAFLRARYEQARRQQGSGSFTSPLGAKALAEEPLSLALDIYSSGSEGEDTEEEEASLAESSPPSFSSFSSSSESLVRPSEGSDSDDDERALFISEPSSASRALGSPLLAAALELAGAQARQEIAAAYAANRATREERSSDEGSSDSSGSGVGPAEALLRSEMASVAAERQQQHGYDYRAVGDDIHDRIDAIDAQLEQLEQLLHTMQPGDEEAAEEAALAVETCRLRRLLLSAEDKVLAGRALKDKAAGAELTRLRSSMRTARRSDALDGPY